MSDVLYRVCAACRGTRLAPPDDAIRRSLPEHSPEVAEARRPGRSPCPGCAGHGYIPTGLTTQFLLDRSRRCEQALEILRDLVALFENSDEIDGASYLSDGVLMGVYVRSQRVLDRDDAASHEAAAHGV